MDISVIIPVYNVEPYVGASIRSVLQQDFAGAYEVIVVDDCATDGSMAVVSQEWARREAMPDAPRFSILHHNHNRGLSAARNTGLDAATGKYILFVDSDDTVSGDCLRKLFAQAEATQSDIVAGGYDRVSGNSDQAVVSRPLSGYYIMAWNKLVLRAYLLNNNIRFIEGLVHEDNPWSFEISCRNPHMSFVKDVTYHYLVRQGSLQTHHDFSRHFTAYKAILQAYSEIIRRTSRGDKMDALERQKALFFAETETKGTPRQVHELYRLIRQLGPRPGFSKADFHYWLPAPLGLVAYRKFHRYHLC